MERRHFLRSILGVAAATALPSEVWPFRKIFLPAAPSIVLPDWDDSFPGLMALELEHFAKSIPNLINTGNSLYSYFKKDADLNVRPFILSKPAFRVPIRITAV